MKVGMKAPNARQMLSDVKAVDRNLADARRRATNATVRQAVPRLQDQMRSVFDRPTRYALNAFRTEFASRDTGTTSRAAVMVKGPQDVTGGGGVPPQSFLRAGIVGGGRRAKQSERGLIASGFLPRGWLTVPGSGARLDAYGNVSRQDILRILAYLKSEVAIRGGSRARKAVLSDKSRSRMMRGTRTRAGRRIFVVPVGAQRGGLRPGVYEQQNNSGRFDGPVNSRPRALLIFVSGAQYSRRLDFYGVLQQHADKTMPAELSRVLQEQRWPGGRT